jgi:CheY-like chemotaxis protein
MYIKISLLRCSILPIFNHVLETGKFSFCLVMKHSSATILVIDDEEQNRKLLDVFIKADGHVGIFATNGESGIDLAVRHKPDLILLDLMMPGMDGFEVARRLKSNPEAKDIPIIAVTALGDIASHKRMLMTGVEEFVSKPFNRMELSLRIFRLLSLQRNCGKPDAQTVTSGGSGNE